MENAWSSGVVESKNEDGSDLNAEVLLKGRKSKYFKGKYFTGYIYFVIRHNLWLQL